MHIVGDILHANKGLSFRWQVVVVGVRNLLPSESLSYCLRSPPSQPGLRALSVGSPATRIERLIGERGVLRWAEAEHWPAECMEE